MITNVELDHHARWAIARRAHRGVPPLRRAGVRAGDARRPRPRPDRRLPADGALRRRGPGARARRSRCPARHNLCQRPRGAGGDRALRRRRPRRGRRPAGRVSGDAAPAATGRRGRRRGGLRRLRPSPDRDRGGAGRAEGAWPEAADRRLSAPPLLADQGAGGPLRSGPGRSPTRSACSTSTPRARSRSASSPGSAGSTSPEPPPTTRRGRPVWWLRDLESAEWALRDRLRDGDLLVTLGAGDVWKLAEALVPEAGR